jgi:glucose-6-phosphate-specific signal transduction histidine kinase
MDEFIASWLFDEENFIYFSLFAFLFLFGIYFNNRGKELEIIKQEDERKAEIEKTRIATEMHDDLGADLSNLLFKLRLYQNSIGNQHSGEYQEIETFTKEIIKKVNETIWTLNSEKDNLLSLCNFMQKFSEDFFEKNEINFKFINEIKIDSKVISIEKRRNIFHLYKDVIKYLIISKVISSLTIKLKFEDNNFFMSINLVGHDKPLTQDTCKLQFEVIQNRLKNINANYFEHAIAKNTTEIMLKIEIN